MSLLSEIRKKKIPAFLADVAEKERVSQEFLVKGITEGTITIPRNSQRGKIPAVAIGKGLFTKVNANIGTSRDRSDVENEVKKAKTALKYGADAIMDLSTWGDISSIRKRIMEEVRIPMGTVPIYELACGKMKEGKTIDDASEDEFFDAVEKQAREGVDFMTIHAGVCRETMDIFRSSGRKMGIVSRGGALTAKWMAEHKMENPFNKHFEKLLDILEKYDVTISLGDGMRPGCIADATDKVQLRELEILGELADRAFDRGVQVLIEGPGHVPLNEIEFNMKIQQSLCRNRPFYVLGPIVTDIAPGYDHITSAIGGAVAAMSGADFLCYVTPAEHLKLPDDEDVRIGVVSARIAAHAADIVKRGDVAKERDLEMSLYRSRRDWKNQIRTAIDPERAEHLHSQGISSKEDACTMCSELCPIRMLEDLENKAGTKRKKKKEKKINPRRPRCLLS
jgi:phosphomethylpyrimidine synthase